MSEKICLQWDDFQANIKIAFGDLREDNDFTDVTLACEDGQQVEAHKVILAEQVLVNKSHCQHHICININNVNVRQKAAAGC